MWCQRGLQAFLVQRKADTCSPEPGDREHPVRKYWASTTQLWEGYVFSDPIGRNKLLISLNTSRTDSRSRHFQGGKMPNTRGTTLHLLLWVVQSPPLHLYNKFDGYSRELSTDFFGSCLSFPPLQIGFLFPGWVKWNSSAMSPTSYWENLVYLPHHFPLFFFN